MTTTEKQQFASECQRRRDNGLVLTGNTFQIKDQIKTAGGIWDSRQRAWLIPDTDTLHTLRGLTPAAARPQQQQRRSWVIKSSYGWECAVCGETEMLDWTRRCCHECGNRA